MSLDDCLNVLKESENENLQTYLENFVERCLKKQSNLDIYKEPKESRIVTCSNMGRSMQTDNLKNRASRSQEINNIRRPKNQNPSVESLEAEVWDQFSLKQGESVGGMESVVRLGSFSARKVSKDCAIT